MTTLSARVSTSSFANRSCSSTASFASKGSGRRSLSAVAGVCAFLLLLGAECIPALAQPNWVQESPASSPTPRNYAALAYDAAQGQVVLFGGAGEPGGVCCGYFGDTWVWNGASWTQEFPANSPSARAAFGMDYDAAQGQVVLFGGSSGSGDLNDTWGWNGTNWTQLNPANSPSARAAFSMVYDAAQGQIVLFGGLNGTGDLNDTWVWNGTNWTQLSPATSPPARSDFDMAYDTVHGQVVLFGGIGEGVFLGDTWVWNGTNWTQEFPATSPPARGESPMAYDAALGQAVLFGGSNGSGTPLNDTWAWDSTNWTQEFPAASPSARVWADMTYDPQQSQVVLFGGLNGGGYFVNDTWVYETGQVTASPTSITYPNTVVGRQYPMAQKIENQGPTKVTIESVCLTEDNAPTCTASDFILDAGGCVAREGHDPLNAGTSCKIGVIFTPKSSGAKTATLSVTTSASSTAIQVPLSGTGVLR